MGEVALYVTRHLRLLAIAMGHVHICKLAYELVSNFRAVADTCRTSILAVCSDQLQSTAFAFMGAAVLQN